MSKPIPSKAAIKGHPIHPMLIPFPIVLIPAALVADIVYAVNDGEEWVSAWATGAAWLLGGAVVMGALAAIAGATDYFGVRAVREHKTAKKHGIGNSLILVLTLVNVVVRLGDPQDAVVPWGLALTLSSAAILAYTGWLGGELSYKHMIGVNPEMEQPKQPVLGSRARK